MALRTENRIRLVRPSDWFVLSWSLLFAAWVAFGLGGDRLAPILDFVFFSVIGPVAGLIQWRVAARLTHPRERLAWRLLACASFARVVSGTAFGLAVELAPRMLDSPWMLALAMGYLAFGIPALLTFPSARWQASDRRRFRLDAATVLIGSLLVVWFFALGPFLRAEVNTSPAASAARFYTIGDSLTVILAAGVYLRSRSEVTRSAAAILLIAFTLQVIPDIRFWQPEVIAAYSAGDPIAAIWYGVWLMKWVSARSAHAALDRHSPEAETDARYRSGLVPYVFLVAATGLLLFTLVTGDVKDRTLFALGSAALALLLLARQGVEVWERDRLHRGLQSEEERFRALLHHAYDAVLLIDDAGEVRYASPATERLLGGVATAGSWRVTDAIHPEDRERFASAFRAAQVVPQTVTMRVRDHAGQWREFEGHLQDQRGDPLIGAYVLNGLDRTREQNLDQRVQDAQQFEALGVLASGLAHDLNNMLLVIASHVEFLGEEDALPPVASRDLTAIRAASDRAQALTQGLLALSRRKSAIRTVIAVEPLIWQRIEARSGVGVRMAEQSGIRSSVRADGTALGHVVDSVLEECVARQAAATRIIRIEERELGVDQAGRLSLEPGSYVVIAAGAELAGAPEQVEDPVKTAEEGEWDLAPSDLSMLMALASVREVGGTVVREREGTAERLAVYLPSVAV